jgi:PAS domain S-box-containing protein
MIKCIMRYGFSGRGHIMGKKGWTTVELFLQNLPFPAFVLDERENLSFANRVVCSLLDQKEDEILGMRMDQFIPELGRFRSEGNRNIHFCGSRWRVWRVTYSRRRIFLLTPEEDAPSAREENLSWLDVDTMISSLYDDVIITDGKGKILKASGNFEKIYGKRSDELIGKTVRQLESEKVFQPSITLKVLKEKTKLTDIQMTKGGRRVLVTGIPVFKKNGEILRVICYSRDITEPVRLKEHLSMMEQEMARIQSELDALRREKLGDNEFVAVNSSMKRSLEMARKVAPVDVNVLLQGESGVGKTAIARYIHRQSHRADGPFIEVNCGAIPEALFESEFFGYEPGSFTGASKKGKTGFAELAHGGTLFLDEISELSFSAQVKVLKFIQEKRYYRIGGTRLRESDFRLIAATNKDLEKMVREGRFREDLYFRLNVVPITIPPLRTRQEDILPLIRYFLDKYRKKYRREKTLDSRAIDCLLEYSWPGNVRELENLIERLVVTVETEVIRPGDLPERVKQPEIHTPYLLDGNRTLPAILAEVEKKILVEAKKRCKSTTEMAKVLGISQSTVVRKWHKYFPPDD